MYEDGSNGEVSAIFIQNGDTWELYGIAVNAPQSRMGKYTPPQEKSDSKKYVNLQCDSDTNCI